MLTRMTHTHTHTHAHAHTNTHCEPHLSRQAGQSPACPEDCYRKRQALSRWRVPAAHVGNPNARLYPPIHCAFRCSPCSHASSYDACDDLDFMSMEKFQVGAQGQGAGVPAHTTRERGS
jgi:hypothetical protein